MIDQLLNLSGDFVSLASDLSTKKFDLSARSVYAFK